MAPKFSLIAVAALAIVAAPCSNAGTEMITDNSAPAPARRYYAPRPRPVLYAPRPIGVVVYPRIGYYGPRFRAYGYHRFYGGRVYRHRHFWR
jgi:hypothetical protein